MTAVGLASSQLSPLVSKAVYMLYGTVQTHLIILATHLAC